LRKTRRLIRLEQLPDIEETRLSLRASLAVHSSSRHPGGRGRRGWISAPSSAPNGHFWRSQGSKTNDHTAADSIEGDCSSVLFRASERERGRERAFFYLSSSRVICEDLSTSPIKRRGAIPSLSFIKPLSGRKRCARKASSPAAHSGGKGHRK